MGAENVLLAHKRWGHLRGDEWRALEWMALRSWDAGRERHGQPARQYWAGYRDLAYGLGLCEDVEPDEQRNDEPDSVEVERRKKVAPRYTHSIKERVRRAVSGLEGRDAISVVQQGVGRTPPRIALHLELATVIPITRPQRHTI